MSGPRVWQWIVSPGDRVMQIPFHKGGDTLIVGQDFDRAHAVTEPNWTAKPVHVRIVVKLVEAGGIALHMRYDLDYIKVAPTVTPKTSNNGDPGEWIAHGRAVTVKHKKPRPNKPKHQDKRVHRQQQQAHARRHNGR